MLLASQKYFIPDDKNEYQGMHREFGRKDSGYKITVSNSLHVKNTPDGRSMFSCDEQTARKARRNFTVSARNALIVLSCVFVLMAAFIVPRLIESAGMTGENESISQSIHNLTVENASLTQQVLEVRDSSEITYRASQELNMQPKEAATTYNITAPSTRPQQSSTLLSGSK